MKILSHYFGSAFLINPSRLRATIKYLCDAGWLDQDADGWYSVHDWEYWQDRHTTEPLSTKPSTNLQQNHQQNVETVIENKEDNANIAGYREKEVKIIDSLRSSTAIRKLKSEEKTEKSAFLSEVKTAITESYLQCRGVSISACTTKGDWVQVTALCRRCESAGITSAAISASFSRWLTNSTQWEQRQSIAWWCAHWQAFAGVNGNGKRSRTALPVSDDTSYPVASDDRILDIAYPKAARGSDEG